MQRRPRLFQERDTNQVQDCIQLHAHNINIALILKKFKKCTGSVIWPIREYLQF